MSDTLGEQLDDDTAVVDAPSAAGPARTAGTGEAGTAPDDGWTRPVVTAFWMAAGALALVIVICGIVAVATNWTPTGDDSFLVMRARDVFSANPPLLSTASSGGASAGTAYNHPGPIVQYLNAPFVWALGTAGAALGCAVINAMCVLAIAWMARRSARATVAAPILVATAAVCWAMGSAVLIDPWNPHIATLSFFTLVVAAWAVVRGRPAALPIGILAGSLAAQTHLSFAAISAVAVAVMTVGAVVRAVRSDDRRPWIRAGLLAVGLGLLSALPPLLEELAHGSDGNLSRLASGGSFGESPVGATRVAQVIAQVAVRPGWFLRGSWAAPVFDDELLSRPITLIGLAAVAAVVIVTLVFARRRRDHSVFDLVLLCSVLLGCGVVVATRFPLRIGVPVPYFRWLWPLVALLAVASLARPLEWIGERVAGRTAGDEPGRHRPVAACAWLLVATLLAVLTLVPYGENSSGSAPWAQTLTRSVLDQTDRAIDDGEFAGVDTVRIDASIQAAALSLLPALIEHLDKRGIDVTMTDDVLLQQSGPFRLATGDEQWALVTTGPDTSDAAAPAGGRRIATYRPLSAAQEAELDELSDKAAAQVKPGGAHLTAAGAKVDDTAGLQFLVDLADRDPRAFVRSALLEASLDHGFIQVDGADTDLLREVSRRGSESDGHSIAVWLVPVTAG